jgi:hypothetical protein
MSLELIGMRELSVEELRLVSGGDGTPNPTLPGVATNPNALNGIINSLAAEGAFANVTTSYWATPYVVAGSGGSQWCWDNPESVGGETVCLDPGVSVNGEAP